MSLLVVFRHNDAVSYRPSPGKPEGRAVIVTGPFKENM